MKKRWIILIILAAILTGCGNTKTLTCTTGADDGVEEIYTFKFTDEKLKTIIVKEIVETESVEEAEEYKKQAEEDMKLFANQSLTTKVTLKDKTVTSVIEVKVEDLKDEDKADYENVTYEEMKKNSEKTGLSCK